MEIHCRRDMKIMQSEKKEKFLKITYKVRFFWAEKFI
jgi:hypothetical protein